MTDSPATLAARAVADAQAHSDSCMKDDALARAKGNSPDHIAARQRVATLFCEMHLPQDSPDARAARLSQIDFAEPLMHVNGRTIDLARPKPTGFLGMGRKPAFLVSERFKPSRPEDPIYCLQYLPLKH